MYSLSWAYIPKKWSWRRVHRGYKEFKCMIIWVKRIWSWLKGLNNLTQVKCLKSCFFFKNVKCAKYFKIKKNVTRNNVGFSANNKIYISNNFHNFHRQNKKILFRNFSRISSAVVLFPTFFFSLTKLLYSGVKMFLKNIFLSEKNFLGCFVLTFYNKKEQNAWELISSTRTLL
jgi:hypothetical protein